MFSTNQTLVCIAEDNTDTTHWPCRGQASVYIESSPLIYIIFDMGSCSACYQTRTVTKQVTNSLIYKDVLLSRYARIMDAQSLYK